MCARGLPRLAAIFNRFSFTDSFPHLTLQLATSEWANKPNSTRHEAQPNLANKLAIATAVELPVLGPGRGPLG